MRDSQRQKVYRAEATFVHNFLNEDPKMPFGDAVDLLEMLCDDFGVKQLREVYVNRRAKTYAGQYTAWLNAIEFSNDTPTALVVLHEFAHHAARELKHRGGFRGHGGHFTETMVDAVDVYFGSSEARQLRTCYEARGALVGTQAETDHVTANTIKNLTAEARRFDRDEEEGTVLIVQKEMNDGKTIYYAGQDAWGPRYTPHRHWAKGFRYPKSADKAGKRLFKIDYEIVETDGYYDAYKRHWVPN